MRLVHHLENGPLHGGRLPVGDDLGEVFWIFRDLDGGAISHLMGSQSPPPVPEDVELVGSYAYRPEIEAWVWHPLPAWTAGGARTIRFASGQTARVQVEHLPGVRLDAVGEGSFNAAEGPALLFEFGGLRYRVREYAQYGKSFADLSEWELWQLLDNHGEPVTER